MDRRRKINNIERCYEDAVFLLKNNSTPAGILASSYSKRAEQRNYLNIFARDASICSLGMVVGGDKQLILSAKKSLSILARYQSASGQIPNFVELKKKKSDFWYTGCADATLWWLFAVKFFDKYSGEKIKLENKYKKEISKAVIWLEAQENPGMFLIAQDEASDWADNMPRSGYVLYTNALWFWIKDKYILKSKKDTGKIFNLLFDGNSVMDNKLKRQSCRVAGLLEDVKNNKKAVPYLSFVSRCCSGKDIDVYGNIIAVLSGAINKKRQAEIIKYFLTKKANRPYPVKVVLNPVKKDSKKWKKYMEDHNQNFPYKYQNGGIWPYVGGFWVIALAKLGFSAEAGEELEKLAEINRKHNFNEWHHGKTGKAMGKKGQSWNAGTFILAYHYLRGEFKF